MDDGLVQLNNRLPGENIEVLILIVVDDGLVLQVKDTEMYKVTKS